MDVLGFFNWLFGTRPGVIVLIVGGLVGFLIAAVVLERKTRRDYDRYDGDEDSEDGWSIFDDDKK